jgi:aryl-alcohol dehydrogenase-like predicted oxidoreductase
VRIALKKPCESAPVPGGEPSVEIGRPLGLPQGRDAGILVCPSSTAGRHMSEIPRRKFNQALVTVAGGLLGGGLLAGCGTGRTGSSEPTGAPAYSGPIYGPSNGEPSDAAEPAAPGMPSSEGTQPVSGGPGGGEGTPDGVVRAPDEARASGGEPVGEVPSPAQAPGSGSIATALVPLGSSGLVVPRLAMGTGTAGWARASDQTRLGQEAFVRLMRHGAERGATFIDAADLYGSHPFVRAALRELPRDRMTLVSKVWFAQGAPLMPTTETARPEVERFLTEMDVDRIDVMLIHSVMDPAWPTQQARMRDELSELKAQGTVGAVGVSAHTHAALRVAAEDPWVDVIFARINPGHRRMDEDATTEQVAETLQLARANGKGVVGMKIYGSGEWQSPEQRRQSLAYALDGLVDAMTIGHVSSAQFDDTVANIEAVLAG